MLLLVALWGRISSCGGSLAASPVFQRIPTNPPHHSIVTRRRLPHLYVIGRPLFVTFRLHGSLPANRAFPNLTSGEAFGAMDRLLDQARSGPTFLRQPAIAQLVLASLDYGATIGHYETHSFVIMPNHVHLLLTPLTNVSKLLGSLKNSTARKANLLLRRTGQPSGRMKATTIWCATDVNFGTSRATSKTTRSRRAS